MNGMRRVIGFLMVTIFAAFALPSSAAPEKIFFISGVPASVSPGSTLTGVVFTFRNDTPGGNSNINSLRLIAPTGWTLSNPVAVPGGDVSGGSGFVTGGGASGPSVYFNNIPGIKTSGKTWKMSVDVNVPASITTCSNAWFAQAYVGNSLNGDTFRLTNSASSLNTGLAGLNNALTFDLAGQTSGAIQDAIGYLATAKVTNSCGNVDGVAVNFTGSGGVVLNPGSGNTSGGTVTSTATFGTLGSASLTASVPSLGLTQTLYFTVFDLGSLACEGSTSPAFPDWTASLPAYAFDGSPGINTETTIKFFKGVRGANFMGFTGDQAWKNIACVPLFYTIVNNVPGTGDNTTSVPGKTVPENAFAMFYDDVGQPNATFRSLQTYRDEWTNASGWIVKRTKVCLDAVCGTQVNLKVCLGTTLVPESMPFFDSPQDTTKRMQACLVSESWQAVPVGTCTAPETHAASASCLRVTSEMLFVGDPVVPRSP